VDLAPHHHCSPGNPEDELVTACNHEAFNQCKGDTCAGIRVLLVTKETESCLLQNLKSQLWAIGCVEIFSPIWVAY
jgi:hypothetical protein